MERNPDQLRRAREIRDIYKKLRVKYNSEPILAFVQRNYFLGHTRTRRLLTIVDKEPVQNPSIIYQTAMADNFNL